MKVAAPATISSGITEGLSEYAQRAKAAWARFIRKVYEADPLECPKCKAPTRVIALIEDPIVVRRILTHLGRWQPRASERAPPVPPGAWPAPAHLPLAYHAVPDIACACLKGQTRAVFVITPICAHPECPESTA